MPIPENILQTVMQATEMSKGDIILRAFIGMVFIMVMMWLAAIVTAKIGSLRKNPPQEPQSDAEEMPDSDTPAEE